MRNNPQTPGTALADCLGTEVTPSGATTRSPQAWLFPLWHGWAHLGLPLAAPPWGHRTPLGTSNHLPPRSRAWPWWHVPPRLPRWSPSRETGAARTLVLGQPWCHRCRQLPCARPPRALRSLRAVRMLCVGGDRGGGQHLQGEEGEPRRGCAHPRDLLVCPRSVTRVAAGWEQDLHGGERREMGAGGWRGMRWGRGVKRRQSGGTEPPGRGVQPTGQS